MKKFTLILLVTFVAVLFISCKKEMLADQKENLTGGQKNKQVPETAFSYTSLRGVVNGTNGVICGTVQSSILYAGQHINAGCVKVWNDAENLYVKYETKYPWKMTEIHLYVGDCDAIPQRNGNPTPGKFPIKESFNWATDCATYSIPLSSICECVCIAAHAVVKNTCTYETETAWGDGCDFSGSNWATYLKYCEQECDPYCDKY